MKKIVSILISLIMVVQSIGLLNVNAADINMRKSLEISKTSVPPKIDGKIDESVWKEKVSAQVDSCYLGSGFNGTEAKFGMLWDNTYLYIAVDVKEEDADFVHDFNGNWDEQDNITMFFDPTTHQSSPHISSDMEASFAYRPNSNTPGFSFGSSQNHVGKDEKKILRSINTYGEGWICEAAIPWDMLSFDPYLKKSLGFELSITDKDSDGSKVSQAWSAYKQGFWNDTSEYGTIILSDNIVKDDSFNSILLEENFEGYSTGDIPMGWISDANEGSPSISVGKFLWDGDENNSLVFDGSGSGKQARITAPVQWDNYTIEADVCFDAVMDNNRWASIMFRVPSNGKNPYNEASIRKSGVWEISYRDLDNKWSIPFIGNWNKGILEFNKSYTMKVRVFDQNIKEYIKASGDLHFDLLADKTLDENILERGKVGFEADQCKVAFDNVKVTRLSVTDINTDIPSSMEALSSPIIPTFTADFSDGVTKESVSSEKVKLYSSNEKVLRVDDGKIYPLKAGRCNIKIIYYNVEKDIDINVVPSATEVRPVSISHDKGYILATKNEIKLSDIKFIEKMSNNTSREVTGEKCQWSFDNPNIAQYINGGIQIVETGNTTATVTKDGISTKVLLFTRKSFEESFVLYEEKFDMLPEGTIPYGWTRKKGTSASKIGVKNGAFEIDARTSHDNPAGILLPEYLANFGNYSIEADITNLTSSDEDNWNSIIYRVQNNDYPYYQMTVRKDATVKNGVEFAEYTGADKWKVKKNAFFTEAINENKMYHYTIKAYSNRIQEWINNIPLIETDQAVSYLEGGIGLQAKGSKMRIDNLKITLLEEQMPGMIRNEDNYSRVVEADTKIAMAPTIVSEINSREDFDRIVSNGLAATAILSINNNLEVLENNSNSVIGTVSTMYEAMKSRVIPAFRVNDADSAKAIAEFLKNNMIEDAFVVSKNPALVKQAREIYTFVRGIVEFDNLSSSASTDELMNVMNTVNRSLSKVAVIPEDGATRYNIKFLQQRLITVWPKETISDNSSLDIKLVALHNIITAGANGIVTGSPELARQALALYNHDTTIVRRPFLIGHRGVPKLAPENTIEGCELAFQLGADTIENDIFPTKVGEDGNQHLVIMHDETINRTTNGSGKVFDKTLEELSTYFVNKQFPIKYPTAKIPTLDQYFEKFTGKDQVIFVEIKGSDPVTVGLYNDLVRKTGYDSHLVTISFKEDQLKRMKEIMPGMSLGFLYSGSLSSLDVYGSLRSALFQAQALNSSFMPKYSYISKEFLEISKHRGMVICPWTFIDKATIKKYFKMGICSMTTNCAQFFSNWAAEITSEQSQYVIKNGESISLKADVKTYKGEVKEVVPEIIVLTGGDKLHVNRNKITAQKQGDAYVTLRYSAKLSDAAGDTYDLYTQPVKIQIQNDATIETTTPTVNAEPTPESTAEMASVQESTAPIVTYTPAPAVKVEPTPNIPSADYSKEIKGHWAEQSVNDLSVKGFISGYKDGTIKLNKLITREEFIKLLLTAAGYEPSKEKKSSFADNDKISKWALGYIIKASEMGIINGYKNNKIMPKAYVTRAEMAVMAMKAFGYEKSANTLPEFIDTKKIPAWAAGYINKAYELDIIKGYKGYEIRPNTKLSRAEAFAVIERCMETYK
ncbi:S-layer homology domain-containing protein [Pseudobacteroides cellulosolvens]|uniref:Glycerophosphoryl diester phosphodiesterase n=1 Tax=Pseudobacteroides cellulosolvens ATCC 35603 = DSM 2933 TaxID=398512 RepID=A0A0L6JLY5_9FIRM|nr:S-layer homology domain-containing protein [Pseudobacteroides cellulosolvens]KNY26750.1 glycerophosphoryl diester phosphodiesterase [Pseudobacteroides cellulosolvens ATCC 35603 = DSM 2933]